LTSAELSENLDWLLGGKPVLTIGRFWPYATTLWGYINRAQPFDEPGSLTHDQVYAVTAYLLYLNGIIGEADVLDARTLPAVKMPNRDGFVPDSRPDVGRTTAPKKR
jgi:cytochrome c